MEPMLLRPAGKDYLWGGNRLKTEYGKDLEIIPLAETWECSTHPDGLSIIAGGCYHGRTLAEVLRIHPEYLGRRMEGKSELPILIKFIDAEKNLSVQVHPDDAYARLHENQNGKTEMWYVLDAKEDTKIVYGFEHSMNRELLQESVEKGMLDKHLRKVPIRKNDVYYIPAGMVHGIGAGALIVEIQVSSNVTYRIWDFDRVGKDGRKRELHLKKAMDVMDMKAGSLLGHKPRMTEYFPGGSREILCRCQYFQVQRILISREYVLNVFEDSFQVLLCLEGSGELSCGGSGEPVHFQKGFCLFLPAGSGLSLIKGKAVLLNVKC